MTNACGPRGLTGPRSPRRATTDAMLRRALLAAVLACASACARREPPAPDALAVGRAARAGSAAPLAPRYGCAVLAVRLAHPRRTPPPRRRGDPSTLPQTARSPRGLRPRLGRARRGALDRHRRRRSRSGDAVLLPRRRLRAGQGHRRPCLRLEAPPRRGLRARHPRAARAPWRRRAASATLVGLEVPEARARWVDPGEEYNKIGYYRVFGSRLRYTVDGEARSFEVKSLISWRGEWYVVHLSAIK